MSEHAWETTTQKGNVLRVTRLAVQDRPRITYEIRLIDSCTHEEFHEEISDDKQRDLVEFLGYPRETSERADELERQVIAITLERDKARDHRRRLIDELRWVQGTVKELVELLADAWWIKAADAHDALSNWVHHHVVPDTEDPQ